jgi:acetyl-CoA carboxylase biotin carboxyl carrier protein
MRLRLVSHNPPVDQMEQRIDQLADLIEEFNLAEAKLEGDDWKVAFRRTRFVEESNGSGDGAAAWPSSAAPSAPVEPVEVKPTGTPVSSPMNGIYYSAPSPSAAPFVKEGEPVTAGQVVGLIEAMKVFNEITAPVSGTVGAIKAETGQLVQPGEVLLYIQ